MFHKNVCAVLLIIVQKLKGTIVANYIKKKTIVTKWSRISCFERIDIVISALIMVDNNGRKMEYDNPLLNIFLDSPGQG